MTVSRASLFICIGFSVVALYVLGVFVRGRYGIAVVVRNATGDSLRDVRVKVQPTGNRYDVGGLAPGAHARIFATTTTESHIELQYEDSGGAPHVEIVAGYIEEGYCGRDEVSVLPGNRSISNEKIDLVACWRSWLDFM